MSEKAKPPTAAPQVVDVVAPTCQPSKEELEEDIRVRATFEQAVAALARRVVINYVPRPMRRRG